MQKDKWYKKGSPSGLEESEKVELKGKKHPTGTCPKHMVEKLISKELGKYWCGWMNQSRVRQASVYIGVHDSGVVQGVRLTSLDKDDFQKRVFEVNN